MTYITLEALRLAEEAFMKIADLRNLGKINPEVIAFETLYTIRAARAQEQAEQEPVANPVANYAETSDSPIPAAWLYEYKPAGTRFVTLEMVSAINHQQVRETPLYVHPMGRQWVGQPDDEIAKAVGSPLDEVYLADFRAVIAADRDKNK